MDAEAIREDTENTETIEEDINNDTQQEVTDADADTEDVIDVVEEDSARDDSELAQIRRDIEALTAVVNSMQSVILENGARIIDTDVDVDGNEGTTDGYYNLDALDLNLD